MASGSPWHMPLQGSEITDHTGATQRSSPNVVKLRSSMSRERWIKWLSILGTPFARHQFESPYPADVEHNSLVRQMPSFEDFENDEIQGLSDQIRAAEPTQVAGSTSSPNHEYSENCAQTGARTAVEQEDTKLNQSYVTPNIDTDTRSRGRSGESKADLNRIPPYPADVDPRMSFTGSEASRTASPSIPSSASSPALPSPPSTYSSLSNTQLASPEAHNLLNPRDAHDIRPYAHPEPLDWSGQSPQACSSTRHRRRNTIKELHAHVRARLQQSQAPLSVVIIVLILSTGIASVCTEFVVDAIPPLIDSWQVSQIFLGFIILPVVGNAAEHVTATKLAMHNKMALAKAVAIESSTQVILLITPCIVLLGWMRGRDMSLQFDIFEITSIIVTSLVASLLVTYGESDWKQGSLLLTIFMIIAVGAIIYPEVRQAHDGYHNFA